MRSLNLNKVLVSVYRKELSNSQNEAYHDRAIDLLNKENISFTTMLGVYNGVTEKMFLLQASDINQHIENITFATHLAYLYNQECILEVHNDGTSDLIAIKSGAGRTRLGMFQQVTYLEAIANGSYTYNSNDNTYWSTK